MEMMVVLLIVAIIAAATAPMVTKKMMRNAGSGDSPWVFTGLGNSIAYNMNGGNATAIIGGLSYNAGDGPKYPRLFINTDGNADHASIAFGSGGNYNSQITLGGTTAIYGDALLGDRSVGVGMGQTKSEPRDVTIIGYQANASDDHSVAIGSKASIGKSNCIAIGDSASAGEQSNPQYNVTGGSIAIGSEAFAAGHFSTALGHYAGVGKTTKNGESVDDAIALGYGSRAKADYATALGGSSLASGKYSTAVGEDSVASGERSTAIGHNAQVTGEYAIAIGDNTEATGKGAVALGTGYTTTGIFGSKKHKCVASGKQSTAIGFGAEASGIQSTAIGWCAKATETNQIVLGTVNDTVYIPGNLRVDGNVELGVNSNKYVALRINEGLSDGGGWNYFGRPAFKDGDYSGHRIITLPNNTCGAQLKSDRRLKNVGEKYTAGLDELKKLDFYHFTFKKDEAKTPMVGVMAQDLQKVFPDAVTKGEDGYLRIRLEDMFYAVINAVKELDSKIGEIVENINGINSKIEKLEKENAELQKVNSDLLKTNSELQEEIKNIEKRIEKLES